MIGWEEKRFGDIVRFRNGKSTKGIDRGGVPVFGSNGIIGGIAQPMYDNAIILGRVGAYCGSVMMSVAGFWATDNTIVVEPVRDKLDLRFGFYLLSQAELNRYATGSAQPLLTQTNLRDLPFLVPPLEDQQRIAAILGAYDDLIATNRRRAALLEGMARGLFEEWFVRLRFPGHEAVSLVNMPDGPRPDSWKTESLDQLGSVLTGKTPSKIRSDYYGSDVPFIKIPDMTGKVFVTSTTDMLSAAGASSQASKLIPAGTLLVSCIGTIGLVSITTSAGQTNQQINALVPYSQHWTEYLYFALVRMRSHLINLGSNGATMGNVNKAKFSAVEVACPPEEIMSQFHYRAKPIFDSILAISKQNSLLAASRDLLLPRLISGHLPFSAAQPELMEAA